MAFFFDQFDLFAFFLLKKKKKKKPSQKTLEFLHKISICFVLTIVVILRVPCGFKWSIYPYPSGLLHWHWGNHMIASVPVKWPWRIGVKSIGTERHPKTCNEVWTVWIFLGMYCAWFIQGCVLGDTLRQRQNGYQFADDIFKLISFNKIVVFWFKFHWNMILRAQSTISQHCFR